MPYLTTGLGLGDAPVTAPGGFLYNWLPDWALAISCDNTDPSKVLYGSACDIYFRNQDAPFVRPTPPIAPPVPINLPPNPSSGEQAAAAVQAIVDERARLQREQTERFMTGVVERLDAADEERKSQANYQMYLLWGLGALVAVVALKR